MRETATDNVVVRAPWIPFDPTMNPQLLREVFFLLCGPSICKIYFQCDDGPRIAHSPIKMVLSAKRKVKVLRKVKRRANRQFYALVYQLLLWL